VLLQEAHNSYFVKKNGGLEGWRESFMIQIILVLKQTRRKKYLNTF
jgi:hypothetical protein